VALSLRALGYSATYAVGVSFLTSLVEPVGCLMGISLVRIAQSFLPWGLALVAGAMLFTLIKEIIPELYNQDMKQETSSGLVLGFVLMAFLDIILN
jgi:ZIP family zinc transporter